MSSKRTATAVALSLGLGVAVSLIFADNQQPDTAMPAGTACALRKPSSEASGQVCDKVHEGAAPAARNETWSPALPANAASALVAAVESVPAANRNASPPNRPAEPGGLAGSLRRTMFENSAAIRECFEGWKKLEPELPTAFDVEFLLEAQAGAVRVTNVEAKLAGAGNAAFGGCVRSVIADAAFDVPPVDKLRVRYRIDMTTQ